MLKRLLLLLLVVAGVWYYFTDGGKHPKPYNPGATELTEPEKIYYRQVFEYAMENTAPGGNYPWESYSGKGIFTPGAPYVSKSKATCRDFTEQLTIGSTPLRLEGVACRRDGRDGWCRLKKTDALTCAMEPANLIDKTEAGAGALVNGGKNFINGISDTVR